MPITKNLCGAIEIGISFCGMDKKRLLLTACPLYLIFFMGDAFLSSYFSLYFIERGMDASQTSILLGMIPFALFLGCFLLSPIAKNPKRAIWLYRICAVLEAGLTLGYAFCTTYTALLAVTFLVAFFNSAPFSFIEGYIVPMTKKSNVSYSSIRIFGTLGYLVALVIGFFILDSIKISDCLFISAGLFAFAFGISFLIPKSEEEIQKGEDMHAKSQPLFTRPFIFYFLFVTFFFGAFNAMTYILPIRLSGLGMSDAEYSLTRASGIVTEMICLLLIPLFAKRLRNYQLPLALCAALIASSAGVGIFIQNPYVLGYSSWLLSGIGKAFYFAFSSLFVIKLCGEKNLSKALVLLSGTGNLVSTLLNLASDTIYTNLTFEGYFAFIAGMEILGIVFLVLTQIDFKNMKSGPVRSENQ